MNTHSKTCLPVLHQRNIWCTCTQFLNTSHAPGQIVIFQQRCEEASSLALWHILRTLAAASMECNANTLLRMTLQTQRRDVEIWHPLYSGCRFPCPSCTVDAKFRHPSRTVDAKFPHSNCTVDDTFPHPNCTVDTELHVQLARTTLFHQSHWM